MKIRSIYLAILLAGLFSCNSPKTNNSSENASSEAVPEETKKDNVLSAVEKEEGWLLLFDGESSEGWRGFNQKTLPSGWIVESGTLKSLGQGGDIGGDIVYGAQEFENFELYLEWKISEGGNSGIFYHVLEGDQYEAPYQNAPEYQLVDDLGFPGKLEEWQKVGADYAMYYTDSANKIIRPAGEWNSSRIKFDGGKVEYWLNGKMTVSFEAWSDDWYKRKQSGKWKNYADYAMAKKGLIGLQDHGSFIWFRNIKIKAL
ncbi:DUF1080 domain-containing protein [Fulvivirgaceae bacterium BMA10]|uniref:DUF1080 domain-containing protein n=1 Tax=Splendidivirga corallicola TaxID=3051826 RepID=A0ABT8KLD2_9BACT|nr:DUF1080 domain-containing protein [Fulvivirgaceae bacterium BMA10]